MDHTVLHKNIETPAPTLMSYGVTIFSNLSSSEFPLGLAHVYSSVRRAAGPWVNPFMQSVLYIYTLQTIAPL